MDQARSATLYLVCGRIAAGKTTIARQLATRPRTVLLSLDEWMSALYPTEVQSLDDFARLTARLRAMMGPLVVDVLRQDVSVVLDFPANTVKWRSWMRSLFIEAGVHHELHVLDVPDAVCRERLRQRNASGTHPYQVSEATYDQFMSYFVPPAAEERFNLVVHGPNERPPASTGHLG